MIKTIILTGTIQVSGQGDHQVRNTQERLLQYMTNIVLYIVDSPFVNIIFCENSNYNISKEKEIIESLAILYGKKIEFIQFQGDTIKTAKQGRGYGESEIMEHVVDHSRILHDNTFFVKITGRYFLTNSWNFIEKNNSDKIMFVRMVPFQRHCSTACYIVTPKFYRDNLRGIGEKVDDSKGKAHQLEGVFYSHLITLQGNFSNLNVLPIMKAMTGSGYILQPNIIKDNIKQFLNILGLYTL